MLLKVEDVVGPFLRIPPWRFQGEAVSVAVVGNGWAVRQQVVNSFNRSIAPSTFLLKNKA